MFPTLREEPTGALARWLASVGAEVEVRPMRSLPALAIEARLHDNPQNLGNNTDPRFLTLGAGTRLKW